MHGRINELLPASIAEVAAQLGRFVLLYRTRDDKSSPDV
jgi:hypothetical protein